MAYCGQLLSNYLKQTCFLGILEHILEHLTTAQDIIFPKNAFVSLHIISFLKRIVEYLENEN